MRLARFAVAAALVFAAAAYAGVGAPERAHSQSQQAAADRITVVGTGSVAATPDRAMFSFGVQSDARSAAQALSANAAEMRRVVAALRSADVAAADIRTETVFLSPRMSEDGTAIAGYTAVNSVSVQVRDLDGAGTLIDAAVAAGANQVSGPVLLRSDEVALYRSALRAAFASARVKAQTLADALDVPLGRVVAVEEAAGATPLPNAERAADTATPIEPGTHEVQASVTVTFAIP